MTRMFSRCLTGRPAVSEWRALDGHQDALTRHKDTPTPAGYVDYTRELRSLGLPLANAGCLALRLGSTTQKEVRDAISVFAGRPITLPAIADIFCAGAPTDKLGALLCLARWRLIDLNRLDPEEPGVPVTSMAHLLAAGGQQATQGNEQMSLAERFAGLSAAGIDINGLDEASHAPVHSASIHNNADTLQALLIAGADPLITTGPGLNALHLAAQTNGPITALLAAGVNIESQDDCGRTPLHHAAQNRQHGVLAKLLAAGAQVDALTSQGATAAHIAASRGDVKLLHRLQTHRANLNARSHTQDTPLHCAARAGHIEAVLFLLGAKADPLARNHAGDTALHIAAQLGHAKTAAQLLARETGEIDAVNTKHQTPLHLAAQGNHLNAMLELLHAGAELECRDERQRTAFLVAAQSGHSGALKLLHEYGANIEARDQAGNTALHWAAIAGDGDVFDYLTQIGVPPKARNHANNTPTMVAIQYRNYHLAGGY